MRLINEITEEAKQRHILSLEDETEIDITFEYRENQNGWFYSFSYEGRTFNNRRVVSSPNMLRQFKDILPFGFACVVNGGFEPIYQADFSEARAKFYLLESSEVADVEETIINV